MLRVSCPQYKGNITSANAIKHTHTMAPRRRPVKRGNTRADAALDAMRQLGFASPLVRKTLKQLLNAYGGDDGWVFIEESSYILLINTLLEGNKDSSDDDARAIKGAETAGPSCRAIEPAPLEVADANTELIAAADVVDFASRRNGALDSEPQIGDTGAPLENIPTVGDQMPVSTPKKRRPYHGWICDAEDHDPNDLIDLIPDSLSESLKKLLRVRKNRLPRWDVMPQEA